MPAAVPAHPAGHPEGYGFARSTGRRTAEFIARECFCCPFLRLMLEQRPGRGAAWLHLIGPDGVKPFILAEIGGALPPSLVPAPPEA